MAKLDNVKVVNENTVEYNGFVYEKIGEFDGKTEIGNLLKCTYAYADFTEGKFYEVINDSKKAVIDDIGDNPIIVSSKFDVYRKSHAITSDKLTDAEGVVTITSPDGSKIVGTPSDLNKIIRNWQAFKTEQAPEEVVEEEVASEPVVERLQVGDYAKLVSNDFNTNAALNEIVEVITDDQSSIPYGIKKLSGERIGWVLDSHLVQATNAEILEAKQALLKVNDYARVISEDHTKEACGSHDYEKGDVIELVRYDEDDDTFRTTYLNGDENESPWVHRKDLEPLTVEEAEHISREAEEEKKAKAERAKWAAIGREVGEIKAGDIVRTTTRDGSVNPVGTIGVARQDGTVGSCSSVALNGDTGNWSSVELIVPVEQRFDKAE